MNNPFDYKPDEACNEAFRSLTVRLKELRKSDRPDDVDFCRELEDGKMLGVLIAEDSSGLRHTLYAFSGQVGDRGFHRNGFVGPVFDYLRPEGHFKKREAEISRLNTEILRFEAGPLAKAAEEYGLKEKDLIIEVAEFSEKCRRSKAERDRRRMAGDLNEAEKEELIRRSQFEKAELRRIKKRVSAALEPERVKLAETRATLDAMKRKRRADSEELQDWLFTNFSVLNANGESRSLREIFAETPMKVPPSGAGECCAPKLLQAAYLRGLRPIAIAEYWYGRPKGGEIRRHGEYYPACRGKCLPVLGWMLRGLEVEPPLEDEGLSFEKYSPEIVYENEWFCVVNKPSGMLSVPGKGRAVSLEEWLKKKYEPERMVKAVHRLDQATSGLLIAAFDPESFKILQSLFATRRVRKRYVAELDGDYRLLGLPKTRRIALPLSPDWLDRPRQRVDFESGKEAVTEYEFIGVSEGRSRVLFHPLTGRTHQLRVHAASELGLGMPIVGDRLYGKNRGDSAGRLRLHAFRIEFEFPVDGKRYVFEQPVEF